MDLLGESLVGLAANEPVRIRPGGWGAEAGPESPEAGNRGGEALRREVTGPDRLRHSLHGLCLGRGVFTDEDQVSPGSEKHHRRLPDSPPRCNPSHQEVIRDNDPLKVEGLAEQRCEDGGREGGGESPDRGPGRGHGQS